MKKPTKHGGARPGAGRKAGPGGVKAHSVSFRLTDAEAAALEGLRRCGYTPGDVFRVGLDYCKAFMNKMAKAGIE